VVRCVALRRANGAARQWRFSVQEAEPESRRQSFNTLEELLEHLRSELDLRGVSDARRAD
jgi:hypothetical protein